MIHSYLALGLTALQAELKLFVGPAPFEEVGRRAYVPVPEVIAGKTVMPGHDGCYLSLASGRNHTQVTFELVLNRAVLGRPEVLALSGQFTDVRLAADRYRGWYKSPHGHGHMLDIFDRVDRMAALALLYLEKAAQETLADPEFQLIPLIPAADLAAVLEYFRVPVQLDHH